jgi:succinyl-CoA synthetase alpha subunit
MKIKTIIKRGEYFDSVKLMVVTNKIAQMPGIEQAAIQMGTELNKEILKRTGLYDSESETAEPNDLMISIGALEDQAIENAISQLDELLNQKSSGEDSEYKPRSFDSAIKALSGINFCIISVPGRFAKAEAMKALKNKMHVLLFSDNVTIEEEFELKKYAKENSLFLMGPDCGTAMINNVPLGFANKVRKGNIGIVGAAGTGMQEVMTLIHKQGSGISQAIGTGGRDLKVEIGGITMMQGIEALSKDDNTKVIVVISKPPAPEIAKKMLDYLKTNVTKTVIVNFIGGEKELIDMPNAISAITLEDAALKAAHWSQSTENLEVRQLVSDHDLEVIAQREIRLLKNDQKYIRGLFSGGTLCYESMLILKNFVGDVHSNTPLNKKMKLADSNHSVQHTCVDLGDDEFTVGRAHPMIDTRIREQMLEVELSKPDVAVIILDVVIGYGTHEDPAQVFANITKKYKEKTKIDGRHVVVISSVCGTYEDPQNLIQQQNKLAEAGIIVMPSNASAARLAGMIALGCK